MSLTNRYDSIRVDLNSNKKRVYVTNLYPEIEPAYEDIYIIPNEQDRLDLLAFRYYNDVRYWWVIAQANKIGKGKLLVEPGVRLRIPKNLSKILSDYDELNKAR